MADARVSVPPPPPARPRIGLLKTALGLLFVAAVGAFFWRAFQRNWATFEAQHLNLSYPRLGLSALAMALTTLLGTLGWQSALNRLAMGVPITFTESVALFNSSGLTKYLPGKVWSYALQMYWLSRRNVSASLITYVNLVNLWVSLATSLGLGLTFLLLSGSSIISPLFICIGLGAVLIADLISIRFSGPLFNFGVGLLNRLFKRQLRSFDVPLGLMLRLHVIHLLAAFSFGLGVYFLCSGVGFVVEGRHAFLVMASLLIADLVGFLAIFVPGGLGVRESVMYVMLGGVASGALAVVLPVACRLVTMGVDVLVGAAALKLLKDFERVAPADDGAVSGSRL